jgi:hypothetical protein
LGAQDRRRRSVYLEALPSLIYLRQTIHQVGAFDGEPFDGQEDHWLLGGLATIAVPIALSEEISVELGANYLWSAKLSKPTGDRFFTGDLNGLNELSFVLGVAVR